MIRYALRLLTGNEDEIHNLSASVIFQRLITSVRFFIIGTVVAIGSFLYAEFKKPGSFVNIYGNKIIKSVYDVYSNSYPAKLFLEKEKYKKCITDANGKTKPGKVFNCLTDEEQN